MLVRTHKLYSMVQHGALDSLLKHLSYCCLTLSNAILASRTARWHKILHCCAVWSCPQHYKHRRWLLCEYTTTT